MNPTDEGPAMNHSNSPETLRVASMQPTAADAWRAPMLFYEPTADSIDSSSTWVLIVTGVLTAGAVAYAFCGLLSGDGQSLAGPWHRWGMALLRALAFVALTVTAGAVDVWMLWHVLPERPTLRPGLLSRHLWVGWIFLPVTVLLEREQSWWMLPVVALATVATTVRLRHSFPRVDLVQADASAPESGELRTLYGLPSTGSGPRRTCFLALCAQTSLLLACAGALAPAGLSLMACMGLLVWRLNSGGAPTGKRALSGLVALALLVTVLAQLPWIDHRRASSALLRKPSIPSGLAAKHGSNYVSIVLWPPVKKRTEIDAPIPRGRALSRGAMTKPLLIPFDGAYWYFEAPSSEPGPQAHIAHGRPTDAGINLRTTNGDALLMEAHQTLGKAIDPRCCREIDVTLSNADILAGRINLGVRLSDSTLLKKPPLLLGVKEIRSSDAELIAADRPSVEEVLRFPLPQTGGLHRFNTITIFFLREHGKRGAKVAIQSFTLVPR